VGDRQVCLYSGNIANKQGIEILIEVARKLHARRDILFVICGEGPNRANLQTLAQGLDNVMFHKLQPLERMQDLLGLASIHLLPQIPGAADLVLPSKLTNMLASGRPVVATAMPGTGLYDEVEGCGINVEPGDVTAMAEAIVALADAPDRRAELGRLASARAVGAGRSRGSWTALNRRWAWASPLPGRDGDGHDTRPWHDHGRYVRIRGRGSAPLPGAVCLRILPGPSRNDDRYCFPQSPELFVKVPHDWALTSYGLMIGAWACDFARKIGVGSGHSGLIPGAVPDRLRLLPGF
jgi:hypothetical protein